MSYFPCDIPYMSDEELRENGIKIHKDTETTDMANADDLISRQAVIKINQSYHGQMPNEVNHRIWKEINELPSAETHEERTETHACDLISRQAAIDAVNTALFPKINTAKDAEKALRNLPSAPSPSRPQEQKYGYWMRMSDLNESEDDRYKCSYCGNVVHHRNKVFLYTYNSWCGACGADMVSKDAHGAWRIHATKEGCGMSGKKDDEE